MWAAAHHCDHCSVRAMLSARIKFSFARFLGFASLVHGHLLRSLSDIIPPDGGYVPSDYYAKRFITREGRGASSPTRRRPSDRVESH